MPFALIYGEEQQRELWKMQTQSSSFERAPTRSTRQLSHYSIKVICSLNYGRFPIYDEKLIDHSRQFVLQRSSFRKRLEHWAETRFRFSFAPSLRHCWALHDEVFFFSFGPKLQQHSSPALRASLSHSRLPSFFKGKKHFFRLITLQCIDFCQFFALLRLHRSCVSCAACLVKYYYFFN